MTASAFDVRRLPELLAADPAWLARARQRQAAVWRGEPPFPPAIGFSAPLTPAQEAIPDADFHTAFHDVERMLCSQVRAACAVANARSDAVPSIRANLGTGILLACVGLEQEVFTDKMPWLQRHLSKAEAAALTPDDLCPRGSFARGLEMMARFREVLGDTLAIYCMDTQGPFDLAHLMLGDALFYEMTDDPPFVHQVMELCLELGIRSHTWMKEITGEPRTAMHHSGMIYTESAGIRICEDTTVLLGPEQMAEFAIPYSRRLAAAFGGAWVHYCGRNDHLTEAICAAPEFRGINFGFIPGHEQDHDFAADMARCEAGRTVYLGHWPLLPGETGEGYLRRLHPWAAKGIIIGGFGNPVDGDAPGMFPDAQAALAFWNGLPGPQ
jgi:hypothetical protein